MVTFPVAFPLHKISPGNTEAFDASASPKGSKIVILRVAIQSLSSFTVIV